MTSIRIGLLLPPGFATLSFAPLCAFEAANVALGEPHYEVHVVSPAGGPIVNSFGTQVETERAYDYEFDTLIVGSGPDTRRSHPKPYSPIYKEHSQRRGASPPFASELSYWAKRADERADGVHLTYDTMVSLLRVYGSTEALAVAWDLDVKIEGLMRDSAGD